MIKKIFATLLYIALFSSVAYCQTATTTPVTPPQITTIMDGITADVGTGWDIRNKIWVQTDTVRFLEYANTSNTGKYSSFLNFVGQVDPRVSLGYDTANKGVVGGAFDLFVPKNWGLTSPLLSHVGISPFIQYEVFSIGNVSTQTKKGLIYGAYIIKASV